MMTRDERYGSALVRVGGDSLGRLGGELRPSVVGVSGGVSRVRRGPKDRVF